MPVNQHDNLLFPESLEKLWETADLLRLDIDNAYLTLDSAFDSADNKFNIEFYNLIPVIKPNTRNLSREKRYALLDDFEKIRHIYKERYIIERSFAWQDKYRKLVVRYEKLECTHVGFKYLSYALINSREIFNKC